MNVKAIGKAHDEILVVLQKHKFSTRELIILMSNVLFSIGASIAGYKAKAPSGDVLRKLYYQNPKNPGLALMCQGEVMSTWYEDLPYAEELTPEPEKQ